MIKSTRENRAMKEVVRQISVLTIPLMLTLVIMGCGGGGGQVDTSSIPPSSVESKLAEGSTAYYVRGNVSSLSGSLVLQNNGEDDLTITSNGVFTFGASFEDGAGYAIAVTIQPEGQVCTVSNGNGIVSGADVTDVFVECIYNIARVNLSPDGSAGMEHSYAPNVSDDGRYVVFNSESCNMVADDCNCTSDVFVSDRETGQIRRVSIATDGTEGNGFSYYSTISGDGRYIAFVSLASNLVADDSNNKADVFVHDMETGETTIVSVASDGTQGNGTSSHPSISDNGRYVAFESASSNITPCRTGKKDVFVHDRETGETIHVSMTSDGTVGNNTSCHPAISGNGRYVAFVSDARNRV